MISEAKPGARVCNLSRSVPGEFPEGFTLQHVPCDLRAAEQRAAAWKAVESFITEGGDESPILLINNAGVGSYGTFPVGDPGREASIVEVNVTAVVDLTARLLPHLKRRGGGIINVASTAAFQPTPILATYGATKSFLLNWSVALREELRPHGVAVTATCPGPVRTPFFVAAGLDGTQADSSFSLEPDKVALGALEGLARNRAVVVPGLRNKFIHLANVFAPRVIAARVGGGVLARVRSSEKTKSE